MRLRSSFFDVIAAISLATGVAAGCGTGSPALPGEEDQLHLEAGSGTTTHADTGVNTFTDVYDQIINGAPECGGCHSGPDGDANLDLSSQATAYASLVRKHVTSDSDCAKQTDLLVDPSHASSSLLYLKVTTPPCGERMPKDGTPLTSAQTALIAGWINAGAKND